ADGKERTIQHMVATTFWSPDGKPMSAAEFIERLFGEFPALFRDEDELRKLWGQPETRKALLDTLAEKGYGEDQLVEISRMINAEKSDIFDVLASIARPFPHITSGACRTAQGGNLFRIRRQAPGVSGFCSVAVCAGRRGRAGSGKITAPARAEIPRHQRCRRTTRRCQPHPRGFRRISAAFVLR